MLLCCFAALSFSQERLCREEVWMESLGDWIRKLIEIVIGGPTDNHGVESDVSPYPGRGPR